MFKLYKECDDFCDFGIVSDDSAKSVVEASKLRRCGYSVYTQFSGNRKKQFSRAKEICAIVIEL